jgi:glycosyltransferase involved in cell wall biosynthesis
MRVKGLIKLVFVSIAVTFVTILYQLQLIEYWYKFSSARNFNSANLQNTENCQDFNCLMRDFKTFPEKISQYRNSSLQDSTESNCSKPIFKVVFNGNRESGLWKDALEYERVLKMHNIEYKVYEGIDYNNEDFSGDRHVIYLWLEKRPPVQMIDRMVGKASQWWMVNTDVETMNPQESPIEMVLCKTWLCVEIMKIKRAQRNLTWPIAYHSFRSEPLIEYKPEMLDYSQFVHLRGTSEAKNSIAVVRGWSDKFGFLTFMSTKLDYLFECFTCWSFRWINERLGLDVVRYLLQDKGVHLCPSQAEGFGHYLNEARAAGALVVTTDMPPMNELVRPDSGVLVPCSKMYVDADPSIDRFIHRCDVSAQDMNSAYATVSQMSEEEKRERGRRSRQAYEEDALYFENMLPMIINNWCNLPVSISL